MSRTAAKGKKRELTYDTAKINNWMSFNELLRNTKKKIIALGKNICKASEKRKRRLVFTKTQRWLLLSQKIIKERERERESLNITKPLTLQIYRNMVNRSVKGIGNLTRNQPNPQYVVFYLKVTWVFDKSTD